MVMQTKQIVLKDLAVSIKGNHWDRGCGWLVVLRFYIALAVGLFQPYRDLEAGDNQSLKFKWRGGESNPGSLAPQAKRDKGK